MYYKHNVLIMKLNLVVLIYIYHSGVCTDNTYIILYIYIYTHNGNGNDSYLKKKKQKYPEVILQLNATCNHSVPRHQQGQAHVLHWILLVLQDVEHFV